MIVFTAKLFSELTNIELYQILKLRADVFIVEQNCVYQDIDNYDEEAIHVFGIENEKIVAYARLLPKGYYHKEVGIGRVVVAINHRRFSYGKKLMIFCIKEIEKQFNTTEILISAQLYLERFYKELGFKTEGEMYLEDFIPHIKMRHN